MKKRFRISEQDMADLLNSEELNGVRMSFTLPANFIRLDLSDPTDRMIGNRLVEIRRARAA